MKNNTENRLAARSEVGSAKDKMKNNFGFNDM